MATAAPSSSSGGSAGAAPVAGRKRRVSYFYDNQIGNYSYGMGHDMKPHRIRMAHHLVVGYDLFRKMQVFRPPLVDASEMTRFHDDGFINFLAKITPDNMREYTRELQRYNICNDCPVFDGLFEFSQLYTSGSMGGAAKLNAKDTDIAINWSGGLHHARKSQASGFCYVNDCVLGILELLKTHQRVLYIDIDIHHGDGVEEAFYTTNRVMTCSFHKFGDGYFPCTGDYLDKGYGVGKNCSINFPLHDGMDDVSYETIFKPVIEKIMERFRPEAVVLQCGADSLAGDRLGCFNLSLKGHGDCVEYVKSFHLPMLVLGGGGYTIRNVARCWTHETAVLVGAEIEDELPYNEYFEYYGPDYRLSITPSNMKNLNTKSRLQAVQAHLFQYLNELEVAPSVEINTGQTSAALSKPVELNGDVDLHPDERTNTATQDRLVDHPQEYYAGDKDVDGGGGGGANGKAGADAAAQDIELPDANGGTAATSTAAQTTTTSTTTTTAASSAAASSSSSSGDATGSGSSGSLGGGAGGGAGAGTDAPQQAGSMAASAPAESAPMEGLDDA